MSPCTEQLRRWFHKHPKLRQWAWFIFLWLAGLITVFLATYPIKWLMQV